MARIGVRLWCATDTGGSTCGSSWCCPCGVWRFHYGGSAAEFDRDVRGNDDNGHPYVFGADNDDPSNNSSHNCSAHDNRSAHHGRPDHCHESSNDGRRLIGV
jgi:hypothetical protein